MAFQPLIFSGFTIGGSSGGGGGGGTVTSVGLSLPVSVFTVTGSPVTNSGTLTGSFTTQSANTVFAGPASGSATAPTFRLLVAADIPNLSSVYVPQSEVGSVNGVASLDGTGHIPLSQLPPSLIEYQGTWNASTNTPTLSNASGPFNVSGFFFIVSTGGTVNFGAGNITFNAGDWVLYNGSIWERAVQSNIVQSVNGQIGVVTVNAINQLTGDGTAGPATGSQSEVFTLATVVSAGTSTKVTYNAKGLITSGTTLSSGDIPNNAANTTGTASNITATSNSTLTSLSALTSASSLVILGSQVSGNISGNATNITATSNSTLTTLSSLSLPGTQVTGNIAGSAGSVSGTNVITNTNLAQMPADTLKGNNTGSTVNAADLTVSQVQTMLGITPSSSGDIPDTQFTAADNQSSPANITGFAFANATVRSFDATVSIVRNNTYAAYKLYGIQRGSDWSLSSNYTGDVTGITFSITAAGQIQYTSSSTGFTSDIHFRAIVTGTS